MSRVKPARPTSLQPRRTRHRQTCMIRSPLDGADQRQAPSLSTCRRRLCRASPTPTGHITVGLHRRQCWCSCRGLAASGISRRRALRTCCLSHGVATAICLKTVAFPQSLRSETGRADAPGRDGDQDALTPTPGSGWRSRKRIHHRRRRARSSPETGVKPTASELRWRRITPAPRVGGRGPTRRGGGRGGPILRTPIRRRTVPAAT